MIFKGFTDGNGNVIPVQGAGTVYNEEKNSLALGKDTIAIGQDQFVFGRKNIEDANKAEIVGGGSFEAQDIEGVYHFSEIDSMEVGEIVEVYGWQPNSKGSLYKIPLKIALKKTSRIIYSGDATIMEVISCVKVESNEVVDLGVVELYTSSTYTSRTNLFSRKVGWIMPIQITTNVKKNIRTLDWEGSEYLAGNLAIGEGSVASSKGQLVFGNHNTPDANKVEVVGGGNGGDAYKIILTYGNPSQQFTLTRIGTSLDINEVNSKASSLMGRPTIFGYKNWTPGENDILVFYFWDRENDGDGLYENYPFFIFLNGKVTHSTEKGMSGNNHRYWVYEPSATPTSVEEIVAKKNIRTLDWQGNQWNAGDITCDDGNGNTISMRDLLSRIATLEAAATES